MIKEKYLIPVSISVFVIADTKVLIMNKGQDFGFPEEYIYSCGLDCEQFATKILSKCLDIKHDSDKWLPVDIRTDMIGEKSLISIGIGFMTILNVVDLPMIKNKKYSWVDVNFDEKEFPLKLKNGHDSLWETARLMFDMVRI